MYINSTACVLYSKYNNDILTCMSHWDGKKSKLCDSINVNKSRPERHLPRPRPTNELAVRASLTHSSPTLSAGPSTSLRPRLDVLRGATTAVVGAACWVRHAAY